MSFGDLIFFKKFLKKDRESPYHCESQSATSIGITEAFNEGTFIEMSACLVIGNLRIPART